MSVASFIEPLLERERREPDATAIRFILDDDSEQRFTVAELLAQARRFAAEIQAAGVMPGDIVIIALRHAPALVHAFWGAVYHGAVPSIFSYANPAAFRRQLKDLVIASSARAVVALGNEQGALTELLTDVDCIVIDASSVAARTVTSVPAALAPSAAAAYLQFTSGSTGISKGVEVSHAAILRFVDATTSALAFNPRDLSISWLPLYHDYGLFAGLVMPVLWGIPAVLMTPFKWVRNPAAFFRAIHRHRATLSWAPNAAYLHAVNAVRDSGMDGVDLSRLRAWVCGGEPVTYMAQQAFLNRFARWGLREAALIAGYGMAENTLNVTVSRPGRRNRWDWVSAEILRQEGRARAVAGKSPDATAVASCGPPVDGARVRILDNHTQDLPERHVGEIVIRTDTQFNGYHRRPDLTAKVLNNGWYRTGDLGYLAAGELHICGRLNDLIKLAGRGIHPQDLEAVAAQLPEIRPGRAVAFGVPDHRLGSEKVVMVCDVRPALSDADKLRVERALRLRVAREMDLALADVHLFNKGWVVRTGNGKMARSANREKYYTMKEDQDNVQVTLSD